MEKDKKKSVYSRKRNLEYTMLYLNTFKLENGKELIEQCHFRTGWVRKPILKIKVVKYRKDIRCYIKLAGDRKEE